MLIEALESDARFRRGDRKAKMERGEQKELALVWKKRAEAHVAIGEYSESDE